jgi:hypothetical protein
MDSLIELKKFYEYKNKLLHATEEFIAYNPLISLPLEMPRTPEFGEQIIKQNFVVGDEMFLAVLSSSLSSGPLSGHKKIEIYKDKQRIIFTKRGGHGYGTNYSKGRNFFIGNNKAYLIVRGTALKDFESNLSYGEINTHNYYLLIFNNILIPTKFPLRKIPAKDENDFPSKSKHIASKIKLWEGVIHMDEGVIHAICYTVIGVGTELPGKPKRIGFIEFYKDGQPYFFENI